MFRQTAQYFIFTFVHGALYKIAGEPYDLEWAESW